MYCSFLAKKHSFVATIGRLNSSANFKNVSSVSSSSCNPWRWISIYVLSLKLSFNFCKIDFASSILLLKIS